MDGLKGDDASRVCRLEAPWTEAVHPSGKHDFRVQRASEHVPVTTTVFVFQE
jgi:hypothetical protein